MTTPTFPGSSQRAIDTVFPPVLNALPFELRDALKKNGLSDLGILQHYPSSRQEDLAHVGLPMSTHVSLATVSIVSLPISLSPITSPARPSMCPSPVPVRAAFPAHPKGPQVSGQCSTQAESRIPPANTTNATQDVASELSRMSPMPPVGIEKKRMTKKGSIKVRESRLLTDVSSSIDPVDSDGFPLSVAALSSTSEFSRVPGPVNPDGCPSVSTPSESRDGCLLVDTRFVQQSGVCGQVAQSVHSSVTSATATAPTSAPSHRAACSTSESNMALSTRLPPYTQATSTATQPVRARA